MFFAPELGKNIIIMHSVLSMINDYLRKCLRDILHSVFGIFQLKLLSVLFAVWLHRLQLIRKYFKNIYQ